MNFHIIYLKIALIGFILSAHMACSSSEETPDERCAQNEVWVNETCLQTCESDANCAAGVCAEGYCTDATRPALVETLPAQSATDIAVTSAITLNFSEPMNTPDESELSLLLGEQEVAIGLSLNEASTQFTVTPEMPLSQGSTYTLQVAETLESQAGISLGQPLSLSFSTVEPLEVTGITPADGATEIALLPRIALSFSKNVRVESLSGVTLTSAQGGEPLALGLQSSSDPLKWIVLPSAVLEKSEQYVLAISTEVTGEDGGVLEEVLSVAFTTGDFIDATAPAVVFDSIPELVGPNQLNESGELVLGGEVTDAETAVAWLSASLRIGEGLFDLGVLETWEGNHFEFAWSPDSSSQEIDAVAELSVQAVDVAGNISENTMAIELDFVAPAPPAPLEMPATSWKFATLPLTFTTELFGSVLLRVGEDEAELLVADEAGEVSRLFTLPSQNETLVMEASAVDSVGNVSVTSWQHTVTRVPYSCLHTSGQFPAPEAVQDESVFNDNGEGRVTVRYRLDPDVAEDTVLHAQLSTQNFVSTPYLSLLLFPRVLGLLKFNDALLHPCAELVSANLAFYSRSVCAECEVSETLGFYGMNTPWDASQVTWQEATSGTAWGEPGLSSDDRDEIATALMVYSSEQDTDLGRVDLTALVQAWVEYMRDPQTGRPNHGLAFFQEDALRADFHSVDASSPEQVPYLELVWMEQP